MGADSVQSALGVAKYVGVEPSREQQDRLFVYHEWLQGEATAAGGIGPAEGDRLWDRHIADSIAFAFALPGARECLDIGTGVGLPGIPLAILFPDTEFTLLDRAGRRCDLAKRAVRVLGLSNCIVRQQEIRSVAEMYDAIVSRAAIPVDQIVIHVKRLLRPGGLAMLGLSRHGTSTDTVVSWPGLDMASVQIPAEILDRGANLLRIEAT